MFLGEDEGYLEIETRYIKDENEKMQKKVDDI
jgi:hypothetical protein